MGQLPMWIRVAAGLGLALLLWAGVNGASAEQSGPPPIQPAPRLREDAPTQDRLPGTVVVAMAESVARGGDPAARLAHIAGMLAVDPSPAAPEIRAIFPPELTRSGPGRHFALSVPPGQEADWAARLQAHPDIDRAEPDFLFHTTLVPNDAYYQPYQWNLRHINGEAAWDRTVGRADVIIAVVDTGLDLGHPDLTGKLVPGYNSLSGGDPQDDDGHGTHVASIAGARTHNGEGIAGVAWGSRIMPVKALNADGSGPGSAIARGIRWAVDQGAHIINLSLGGVNGSFLVEEAIAYAYQRGVLVVAASGNAYLSNNPTIYPAAYNHVLTVAATTDQDGHASYSSSGSHVDVAAPGGDPLVGGAANARSWIAGAYWRGSGLSYAQLSGTSQAAPQVAGLAALLLSINPTLSPDQLRHIITSRAVDVQAPGWDPFSGYGRIDLAASVRAATESLHQPATPSPATATPRPTATPLPPTPLPTATPTVTPTFTPAPTPTPTAPPRPAYDMRINSSITGTQDRPLLSINGGGDLIALWRDGRNGSDALFAANLRRDALQWGPNVAIAGSQKARPEQSIGQAALLLTESGTAHAVWADGESLRYSHRLPGQLYWEAPALLSASPHTVMDGPVLGMLPGGGLVAAWQQSSPEQAASGVITRTQVYWSQLLPGGDGWQPPALLAPGWGDSQRGPTLAVTGDHLYAAWLLEDEGEEVGEDGTGGTAEIWASHKPVAGTQWANPTLVSRAGETGLLSAPSLGMTAAGEALIAWRMGDAVCVASGADGRTFQPERCFPAAPGQSALGRPHLSVSQRGAVLVWPAGGEEASDIWITWRVSGVWSPPRQVNDPADPALRLEPQVVMDANGYTNVAWSDHRTGLHAPEIYARFLRSDNIFWLGLPLVTAR